MIKLYIDITKLTSFALSTSVLVILFMQSLNRAQFLNIIFLFISSNYFLASSVPAPVAVVVSSTSIYASIWSHKRDFIIEGPMFLVSHSNPFPFLNLDGLFGILSNEFIIFLVFHYILYILI